MFQFTNSLDSLILQKKGKSRCINQENPRGEKGKGGMASGSSVLAEKVLPACRRLFPEKQKYWLKWKDRV